MANNPEVAGAAAEFHEYKAVDSVVLGRHSSGSRFGRFAWRG